MPGILLKGPAFTAYTTPGHVYVTNADGEVRVDDPAAAAELTRFDLKPVESPTSDPADETSAS